MAKKAAKKTAKKTAKKAAVKTVAKKAAKKVAKKTSAKKAAKKAAKPSKTLVPSNEAIQEAAYYVYLDRVSKGIPGSDKSDWIAAERSFGA